MELKTHHAAIALAWLAYFALHSLLADSRVKAAVMRRRPHWMPAYRLGFNVIAVLTLIPVLWLVYGVESAWLWRWQGKLGLLINGLALFSLAFFFISTRAYDMGEFLGTRQLREQVPDEHQNFTLSSCHRFVRHPWYAIGLVLIWTRDMNEALLVSALALTAYFVIGSMLEERKLVVRYGESYLIYMRKVPALVPRPWKYLSVAEACALINRRPTDV